jgi:hypothetical protein
LSQWNHDFDQVTARSLKTCCMTTSDVPRSGIDATDDLTLTRRLNSKLEEPVPSTVC